MGAVKPNWPFPAWPVYPPRMTQAKNPFRYFVSSPEVIRLVVAMYVGTVKANGFGRFADNFRVLKLWNLVVRFPQPIPTTRSCQRSGQNRLP